MAAGIDPPAEVVLADVPLSVAGDVAGAGALAPVRVGPDWPGIGQRPGADRTHPPALGVVIRARRNRRRGWRGPDILGRRG